MGNRTTIVAAFVGLLVLTGGCSQLLSEGPLSYQAESVSISDTALSKTGYEKVETRTYNRTRNFTIAGEERRVHVKGYAVQYGRNVSVNAASGTLARVGVLSSPKIDIANKTFNPLDDLSNKRLVKRISRRYDELGNVEKVGQRSVTILNESRTVTRFEGTVSHQGTTVDVYIEVTKFSHGDDYLVVSAVYPRQLDGERARVNTMFRNVVHGE